MSNRSLMRTACCDHSGGLSMTCLHGSSMNNGFCEYQGHLGGADAFWVSIEFDENIEWFL